ncbi:unnamed protein product [marine sediment metagenome]|uniref:Uncharacterized protein n=1 Tax=marine sediment metagenome TaxID=412755 RepID=X0ZH64_9ZZZZ
MKRPKTKRFKHQKDLIQQAVRKAKSKTQEEKIQQAVDRLRRI